MQLSLGIILFYYDTQLQALWIDPQNTLGQMVEVKWLDVSVFISLFFFFSSFFVVAFFFEKQ